ncbi:hypothetical protein OIV57_17500 [Burkholderia pseudomallei]|uniref:hypothetical protein n=2 Tax=Burkholderia pseudomallei TaxID=28450 RepID=UPI0021F6F228|nr:hypothetical protein [Burkholderia pseudomallei]MCV9913933.1 hypothetical protein [Burkholderia pseudomallei]
MATAKEIGDKWKSKIKDLEDKRNEVNKEKDIQDYTLKNMFIDDLKSNKDERFEKFHTLDYLYGLKLYDDNLNSKYSNEEAYKKYEGKEYYSEQFMSKDIQEKSNIEKFKEVTTLINAYKLENTLEKKEVKSSKMKI